MHIVPSIRTADGLAYSGARRIYTGPPNISRLLMHHIGVASDALWAPRTSELFFSGESMGSGLVTDPVTAGNRQHLLIRALRGAPCFRLVTASVVAGQS
jgi:hypothetical protein